MFVVSQCAISHFLSGMSKFLMGKYCLPEPVPIEMLQHHIHEARNPVYYYQMLFKQKASSETP